MNEINIKFVLLSLFLHIISNRSNYIFALFVYLSLMTAISLLKFTFVLPFHFVLIFNIGLRIANKGLPLSLLSVEYQTALCY
jgi:hypothetical protein